MEDFASELNVRKSVKLFQPYMNSEMNKVCIVREKDDKYRFKNGIYDIFAEVGYDHTKLKGFRFPNRELIEEEKSKLVMYEGGYYIFMTYIKENYGVDFTSDAAFSYFSNSLCFKDFCEFENEKFIFTIYNTHRRIRHRCFDEEYGRLEVRGLDISTITEKGPGFSSETHCPLCLGYLFDMGEKEYKELNEIRNFYNI